MMWPSKCPTANSLPSLVSAPAVAAAALLRLRSGRLLARPVISAIVLMRTVSSPRGLASPIFASRCGTVDEWLKAPATTNAWVGR